MSNLNQHVKSDKVKWIVTGVVMLLMLVLIGGLIASVVTETNPKEWFEKPVEEQPETPDEETLLPDEDETPGADFETNIENSAQVMLAVGAATTAAEGQYVEKTITATVLPESAPDKTVDWFVAWEDGSDADIDNYVQVIPDADGSCNAAIRCYAAFEGTIVVTCVTRDGGFSATCEVTFVGEPSEITFQFISYTPEVEDGVYIIPTNKSLQVRAGFSNIFGSVKEDLAVSWSLGFEGSMSVQVVHYVSGAYEGSRVFEATDGVIPMLSDIGVEDSMTGTINVVEEGLMSIATTSDTYFWGTPKNTLENCSFNLTSGSLRRSVEILEADGFITLTAKCSEYDLEKTIKVKIESSVSGVNLSQNSIVF